MRRSLRCAASAALMFGFCSGTAYSCINDIELPQHEREFRSQYELQHPPLMTENRSAEPPLDLMATGGWVLLAAATLLACARSRSGNPGNQ